MKPDDIRRLRIAIAILLLGYSVPIFQLVRFALGNDLYSHVILLPFVSAYLVWLKRPLPNQPGTRLSPLWALVFIFPGGCVLSWYYVDLLSSHQPPTQDSLALVTYSLVLFLSGTCCWLLSRPTLRMIAFPLGFLVFLAPFPVLVEAGLEKFLQHGSSFVAEAFFKIIGTPVFRDGTVFHLPGFDMQVAPECSGIHSTLALLITSLVAGQILLRSHWTRAVLALAVLPIALLRNGLRVTTIGELCVRIGPEMIDSYIHRHGGPIFFAISLVPFSLLLFLLLRFEKTRGSLLNPTP